MIQFTTSILRFSEQGEKTGWTYIVIPAEMAQQLMPGVKKTFRVKGYLDDYKFEGIALLPMGGGDFIMALNASIRKAIGKTKGATLQVKMEVDKKPVKPPTDLIECLKDEPKAMEFYQSLTIGHKNYFTKWIESAKTEATKTKRIAQAITAFSNQWDFGTMLRSLKSKRTDLMR